MYEIDREKFGTFVAALRKEKGYTQKELAGKLFVSDKAVSKWETAQSIPDTALLIPLAELLGVSVTELLTCERMTDDAPMDRTETETIVKKAIVYSENNESGDGRVGWKRNGWVAAYLAALLLGLGGLWLCYRNGVQSEAALTMTILGIVFGAYFCFFARTKLPTYYDENRITGIHDGMFRMNIPGIAFNNSNWPHIIRCGRRWACLSLAGFPLIQLVGGLTFGQWWSMVGGYVLLGLCLVGLFVPVCVAAKKYE